MNRLAIQKCIGNVVLVCGIFASYNCFASAQAAAPPAVAPVGAPATFGSVDIDAVAQASKSFLKDQDDLKAFGQKLKTINTQLTQGSGLFLSNDQMRELEGLYEKDQPTDAEKKRIAELEGIGDQRKGEVSRLENTATPTEEQRRRFQELNTMHQQGEQNITAVGQDFENRFRARDEEILKKHLVAIREAIGVVAKEKGLAVVFDSKFALYAQVDITADVSKQVNK